MEISCQQCSTAFTIDMVAGPGQTIEVVCPGCFQLHKVVGPPARAGGVPAAEAGVGGEAALSPLGDGGVADRLRGGFTLGLELRHASWPEPRRLNPFEIRQLIYERQLDGSEECRENAGRWFPIGDHPQLALVFQLVGLEAKKSERQDSSQTRFVGWSSVATAATPPEAAPVIEEPVVSSPAPRSVRLPLLIFLLVILAVAVILAVRALG